MSRSKKVSLTFELVPDYAKIRNEMHFNIQRNTRANVFVSKKHKKEKHVKKIYEGYYD